MNVFYFGGKCSRDFGIYISGSGTFNAPERDVEPIEIPGRNGALIVSNNRFRNIIIPYPAFIRSGFYGNSMGAKAWLLGKAGYQRLEDSYHPNYYRMAMFYGPIDFEMKCLNQAGEMTLNFDCKPQRWLKSGESKLSYFSNSTLCNDWFPAKPLINVYGNGAGNLYVGNYAIEIMELDGYVTLDSDTQNAYKDTLNKNNTISAPEFPILEPGKNTIYWDGGITHIDITPRWWTI